MLQMRIVSFCKKCRKEISPHEVGNGKPCKYCGGDIISQSRENFEFENFLKDTVQQRR